jgi:hypothetical protein
MRIKKYSDFITESTESTTGQWVEKQLEGNKDLVKIVNKYINNISPDISVSNAVNLLSDYDQKVLIKEIEDTISGHQDHTEVIATTDVVNENTATMDEIEKVAISGKYTFNCFLYVLTALQSKLEPNWKDCPRDYYAYWSCDGDKMDISDLLSRYRSLQIGAQHIQQAKKTSGLFYGVSFNNNTVYLDYGVLVDGERILMGQFKMTDSVLISILNKPNKSLNSFRKELKDTTIRIIKLFMIVKRELLEYKPSNYQERSPIQITNGVMSFGLYGVGKWDGMNLDQGEYENIKQNFKTWLTKYNWSEKILVSVKPHNYWIYFNIKIK